MVDRHLPQPITAADMYLAAIYDRLGTVLDRLPSPPEQEQDGGTVELREPVEAPGGEVHEPVGVPPRPAAPPDLRASKAAWIAYAVEQGYDEDEARGMTKADLVKALN